MSKAGEKLEADALAKINRKLSTMRSGEGAMVADTITILAKHVDGLTEKINARLERLEKE